MIRNRKFLAFSMAGAFFMFVCVLFASIVMLGWSATRGATAYQSHNYGHTSPPPPTDIDPYGGRLMAEIDGQHVQLPTLKTDYDVDVRGDLVAVQVTQRFENPGDVPLNATYQFPLHEDAAVYAMTMRVGDEVIRAEIQEEREAEATYEAAKSEGKAAALLDQHRPNFFVQHVANLMPGKPVEIELRYVHAAERLDGEYHFVLPLAVGPRFSPGTEADPLPSHPPVQQLDAPATIDPDRVSVTVRVDAGMPIVSLHSETHEVDVQRLAANDARVQLTKGRVLDNRHFELSYALAGAQTQAGLLGHYDAKQGRGYFSLLIEPPALAPEDVITPREMVFVLDCSGSMSGQPMEASKAFMRQALRQLRPTDMFRVIRFSDAATEYSQEPIVANAENIEEALEYVSGLYGSGGTHMSSGILQALDVAPAPGTIRLVTFMTDGYIGNDADVVRLLREHIGDARLFSIGVGTGVNRYLIEEMARTGRGFARYVDPTEDNDQVAMEIAARLQSPVLTDIRLAASDAGFGRTSPEQINDLFAGQSVRVTGVYTKPGKHRVIVRGNVAGSPVEIPLDVELPATASDGDAVRLTWARSRIDDRMHLLNTPHQLRELGESDDELQGEVTQIGLNHSLMTNWTSFVAVSDAVVNANPSGAVDAEVPVSQVEAVGASAYRGASFSGGPTPEPGIIGGLLLTLLAAGGASRRRKAA